MWAAIPVWTFWRREKFSFAGNRIALHYPAFIYFACINITYFFPPKPLLLELCLNSLVFMITCLFHIKLNLWTYMGYINISFFLFSKRSNFKLYSFKRFLCFLHLLQIQRVKTKTFFRLNYFSHTFSVYNIWYTNEITLTKCEYMKYSLAEINRN